MDIKIIKITKITKITYSILSRSNIELSLKFYKMRSMYRILMSVKSKNKSFINII